MSKRLIDIDELQADKSQRVSTRASTRWAKWREQKKQEQQQISNDERNDALEEIIDKMYCLTWNGQ